LLDALQYNFGSIEVDIHLVGKSLLVGHDEEDLKENQTLQSLYLDPLLSRANKHNGRIYPQKELILLIDIKTAAEPTYKVLRDVLKEYSDMLTSYTRDNVSTKAVAVVISGNRPRELMLREELRYATYDSRLPDLESDLPKHFIRLVSDNWANHFSWTGSGPMTAQEHKKLARITKKVHSKGYLLRFWNLPASDPLLRTKVWTESLLSGVDLINIDDLRAYHDFILKHPEFE